MPAIDIDFEVFKALTVRRENEAMTENDVIRELLGLNAKPAVQPVPAKTTVQAWICKGVAFPVGTEFQASYKGETVRGAVESKGVKIGGRLANSPSQAANFVTGTNVNGWTFWRCRFPGESKWKTLESLRVN